MGFTAFVDVGTSLNFSADQTVCARLIYVAKHFSVAKSHHQLFATEIYASCLKNVEAIHISVP